MSSAPSGNPFRVVEADASAPRIESLLIKPASALCNLDCEYCFYLDREADPYDSSRARIMTLETLCRLVEGYLAYSFPDSAFAFQGGEPTLTGLDFFQSLVEIQKRTGRPGQVVSNSIQTNGTLLTSAWCKLFREYRFLVGISLDGPEDVHDVYRVNKARRGTWRAVMDAVALLQRERVDFNVLAVVSQANVRRGAEVYRFFRGAGIDFLQFIPLVEFAPDGRPEPYSVSGDEYGRFLCDVFDLWWPERRSVRIRHFDNIAEALAGQTPGTCTMRQSCDSYAVVEYNGDVYPCDFFVEAGWKLGNIHTDTWPELAQRTRRRDFASRKLEPHPECTACSYFPLCRGGCPSNRHAPRHDFADLDPLCAGYKMIFAKSIEPLRRDLRRLEVL